jgi:hypothetical protein
LKKKITLQNTFNIPDFAIGISTALNDYKLVWELNQILQTKLFILDNKIFTDHPNNREFNLSVYYYKTSDSEKIFLIKLKYDGINLIPGLKQFDYLFISEFPLEKTKTLLSNLTTLNIQGGCFFLELNQSRKSILRKIII